jgi:uncharacterized membrane protein YdjX (TVP38/TMEM64 family)
MTAPTEISNGKRKLVILAIAVAIGAVLTWYMKNYFSLEALVAQEERVREAIDRRPWRSFALGLVIYSVVSLVPGTSGKSVVFAWLFGFWQGLALIILGLTTAAMVIFNLSRYVFHGWIKRRYGRFLSGLNRHLHREGAFYLLTLRMAHFPFTIVNLVSGASGVRAHTFCWTTCLGLIPGSAVFAYVGTRLPSLNELSAHGVSSLVDKPLITALATSATFPFAFRFVARKLGLLKDKDGGPDSLATDQSP